MDSESADFRLPALTHLPGCLRACLAALRVLAMAPTIADEPCRIFLKGTGQVNWYQFDMRSHRFTVSESVRLCLAV
jgi:hypothetical protein